MNCALILLKIAFNYFYLKNITSSIDFQCTWDLLIQNVKIFFKKKKFGSVNILTGKWANKTNINRLIKLFILYSDNTMHQCENKQIEKCKNENPSSH